VTVLLLLSCAGFLANAQEIQSLQLIDVTTNLPIMELTEGVKVDLQALGYTTGPNFSVRATTDDSVAVVASVRFGFDAKPTFRTENVKPFALCGDKGSLYYPCSAVNVGSHTLTATPFAGKMATGVAGAPYTINFSIVGSATLATSAPISASPVTLVPGPTEVAPILSPLVGSTEMAPGLTVLAQNLSPMVGSTEMPSYSFAPTFNAVPSKSPTDPPFALPTAEPSDVPSKSPTDTPIAWPSAEPSKSPTETPIAVPSTEPPTNTPTDFPSLFLTLAPSTISPAPTASPMVVGALLRLEVRNAKSYALIEKLDGGEVMDLDKLNIASVNILARPDYGSSGVVNSVVFSYNGVVMSVRNVPNLLWMCDDACNFGAGEVTLSATPFSGLNGTGMPGESQTVTFTHTPPIVPTASPSNKPSDLPPQSPTDTPTTSPRATLTDAPSQSPTKLLTDSPSQSLTTFPTDTPSQSLTTLPTDMPSQSLVVLVPGKLIRLQVIDASSKTLIKRLDGGEVINLGELGLEGINILAETSTDSGSVGSVVFEVGGESFTANVPEPFWMCGEDACDFETGEVDITAIPFSGQNGTGTQGEQRNVTFTFVAGNEILPTLPPTFEDVLINCGGPEWFDFKGRRWMKDDHFVEGSKTFNGGIQPMENTQDDFIYYTERHTNFEYQVPVPPV